MALFFSPSVAGFFDDTIHADMPEDVRPITAERHAALMAETSLGRLIVANDNGDPVAAAPVEPSAEILLSRLRSRRDRLLRESDFSQLTDAPLDDEGRADWRTYRQSLRDLPELYEDDPASAIWPAAPAA